MNSFLHWWVVVISVGTFLGCWWLIVWSSKPQPGEAAQGEVTGHVWDGDLQEYNNPLPRWWLWLFYITIAFGFVYMALYPTLGNWQGLLGWSEVRQYEEEIKKAEETYGPIFARYAATPIPDLIRDPEAMGAGQRLFLTYCAQCHGSDGRGAPGFPNLADTDWLYGGDPDTVKATILDGRTGNMPSMAAALGGDEGVDQVVNYVLSLSGAPHDAAKAEAGKAKFAAVCAGCHGMDGRGSALNGLGPIGAPNLTDDIWLYGGSAGVIRQTIEKGRSGQMPAWREFLGEDKAHLLAAYVLGLSAGTEGGR